MIGTRRCLALLLLVSASCAKASAPAGDGELVAVEPQQTGRKNPNIITRAELLDPMYSGMDALRAIRQLRPAFFRPRGPQSFSDPVAGMLQISHDYGPLQPVSQLSTFDSRILFEVRYLNESEAATRFGINANGGPVIVLLSSKQP